VVTTQRDLPLQGPSRRCLPYSTPMRLLQLPRADSTLSGSPVRSSLSNHDNCLIRQTHVVCLNRNSKRPTPAVEGVGFLLSAKDNDRSASNNPCQPDNSSMGCGNGFCIGPGGAGGRKGKLTCEKAIHGQVGTACFGDREQVVAAVIDRQGPWRRHRSDRSGT